MNGEVIEVILVMLFVVGITWLALFSLILDAVKKHKQSQDEECEGDIFVNKEGDMYAQFEIPIDAIIHKKSVHMRVHYVKSKKEKE